MITLWGAHAMNYVEAAVIANELAEKCVINKLRRHKQPETRSLKEFGIGEEGYCIFCEDFYSYRSAVQNCIRFFVKQREFDSIKKENNLIIF